MTHNADPLTGDYDAGNRGDRLHGIEQEVVNLWLHIQQIEQAQDVLAQQLEVTMSDVQTLTDDLGQEDTAIGSLTTSVATFIKVCEAMDNKPTDLTAALATVKADMAKLGALQGAVDTATPAPVPTPPPAPAPVPTPPPAPAPVTLAPSAPPAGGTSTPPAPAPTDGGSGTPPVAPAPTPSAS